VTDSDTSWMFDSLLSTVMLLIATDLHHAIEEYASEARKTLKFEDIHADDTIIFFFC